MINYAKIAKQYGIKVIEVTINDKYCKSNGTEKYVNTSYIVGVDTIYLGIYEDLELKTASFFHEIGHTLIDENFNKKVDYNTIKIEKEAWKKGIQESKKHKIVFSKNVYNWSKKQIATYKNTTDIKDGESFRINLNQDEIIFNLLCRSCKNKNRFCIQIHKITNNIYDFAFFRDG